jgi:hypothetical protein
VEAFETRTRRGGNAAVQEASRFFVGADAVFDALREVTQRLQGLDVPYAVAGGMALVAHGHRRTTEDVDILVTDDGLHRIHESLVGLGYRPLFEGSKNLRDSRTGVRVEFLVTGQYPGDGKPKPVCFPDPQTASVEIDGIRYLSLPRLIELKLASGMTNPARLQDLADVQGLIRTLQLPPSYAEQLDPYVRQRFSELAAALRDPGASS